jgi:hypothetical protein
MSSKFKSTFLAILVAVTAALFLLAPVQPAMAQLAQVGPTGTIGDNLANGFPVFWRDSGLENGNGTGVSLIPCLDRDPIQIADPAFIGFGICGEIEGPGLTPPLNVATPNFPDEFVPFDAEPVWPAGHPLELSVMIFGLEGFMDTVGGVIGGDVIDGSQAVGQGRRMRFPDPGFANRTFDCVSPFGNFQLVTDDRGRAADIGVPDVPAPGVFGPELGTPANSIVGPNFLLPDPDDLTNPTAFPGYIGPEAAVLVDGVTVIGGRNGVNSFTLTDTVTGEVFTTNRWNLAGKLQKGVAVQPKATFVADAVGSSITVETIGIAGDPLTETFEVTGTGLAAEPLLTGFPMTTASLKRPARFSTGPIALAAGETVPLNVTITVNRGLLGPTAAGDQVVNDPAAVAPQVPVTVVGEATALVPMTDAVTITGATFVGTSATEGTLTVTATSSNALAPLPTFVVATDPPVVLPNNVIPATGTLIVTSPTLADGATVTVTSAQAAGATLPAGGTATAPVAVTPFVAAGGGAVLGGGGGGGGCFINSLLGW